jgi:hypothetical protein
LKLRKLFLVLILSVIVAYAFYTKYDDDYISPSKYEVSKEVIDNIIAENITPTMTDYDKIKAIGSLTPQTPLRPVMVLFFCKSSISCRPYCRIVL